MKNKIPTIPRGYKRQTNPEHIITGDDLYIWPNDSKEGWQRPRALIGETVANAESANGGEYYIAWVASPVRKYTPRKKKTKVVELTAYYKKCAFCGTKVAGLNLPRVCPACGGTSMFEITKEEYGTFGRVSVAKTPPAYPPLPKGFSLLEVGAIIKSGDMVCCPSSSWSTKWSTASGLIGKKAGTQCDGDFWYAARDTRSAELPVKTASLPIQAHELRSIIERLQAEINRLSGYLLPEGNSVSQECTKPTSGWKCTRGAGHPGPCAAVPVV